MKINAINNQQTFKGLFVDHSKENGGNWKMEYRPYSWELEEGKPVMQNKKQINYQAAKLPNNEERFFINSNKVEVSQDIFGTTSYYKCPPERNNGEMRSRIDVGLPMNREDSLNVYLQKMEKFNQDKRNMLTKELKSPVDFVPVKIAYENEFKDALSQYNNDRGFFGGAKTENVSNMIEKTKLLYDRAQELYKNAMKYINVNESIPQTETEISKIKEELSLIEKAKKEHNYIDISNRGWEDADRPLINYLDEIASSGRPVKEYNKLIVLPGCTRWMKDIFNVLHEYAGSSMKINFDAGLSQEAKTRTMELVRFLIKEGSKKSYKI